MARLVVITKGLAALPHDLNDRWITIGRADGNIFQITEPSVSGRHCEVRLKGNELAVRDLQSTNGTFVDGKRIAESTLKLGQVLRLGEVELRFDDSAPAPKSSQSVTTKIPVPPLSPVHPTNQSPAAAEAMKKFQVLFVDDNAAFLETLTDMCSLLSGRAWEIHSAQTADAALTILQQIPIDLAVLDIGMPMLDGLQLLGIVNRRYPAIKIAVVTGNASEARRADALASGAEVFLEKPVSPEGIKMVFNQLNELISWTQREGFTGALRQVNLHEVIQMECIARHSSILEIRNQKIRGQIFIEVGAIIHAAAGPLVGEAAFNQLMSMSGGQFQLKPFVAPPQRTVQGDWEFLLMEAARRIDEETVLLSKNQAEAASRTDEDTVLLSKNQFEAAAAPSASPPPAEKNEPALGDEIVVVATYDGNDGKWEPVDDSKKTSPRDAA